MTTPPKTSVRDALIGGAITITGLFIFAIVTGAWSGKESAADHRADVQAVRADIRRVLDVLCADHPSAPQCNQPPQP